MALATNLKRFGLSNALVRRNPVFYRSAARVIRELETPDSASQEWVDRRLREILAVASRTAYGHRVSGTTSLADWPVLEKEAVRERPGDFVSGRGLLSIAASTSGTSGTPLQLRRSFAAVAHEQAMIDRCLERMGVAPAHCRGAVLRADDIKPPGDRDPPYWRAANGGERLLFSSNHLDASTVGAFVEALRNYAPDVLFAYPSVLDSLCVLMAARGLSLRIPVTLCSSEVLSPVTSQIANRVLGTRLLDYYGQAERVAFASGSPETGYRFDPSYSVNELRWAEDQEDGSIYELIGTSLWNEAMPLVRYRTGDHVRLQPGTDPAAVARGAAGFLGIIGRSEDVLMGPNGARYTGINHIPRGVPGVIRTQFIQESVNYVRLLVIPTEQFSDASKRLLLEHAALKLPPSMQVHVELAQELERTASGKAPLIIRRL